VPANRFLPPPSHPLLPRRVLPVHAVPPTGLAFITTESGSRLLTAGWWGVSRHINYFGDWLMGVSWCLPCGFGSPIPYFYAVYFAVLLIHRQIRDDHKVTAPALAFPVNCREGWAGARARRRRPHPLPCMCGVVCCARSLCLPAYSATPSTKQTGRSTAVWSPTASSPTCTSGGAGVGVRKWTCSAATDTTARWCLGLPSESFRPRRRGATIQNQKTCTTISTGRGPCRT
jgi:hypothetical protein